MKVVNYSNLAPEILECYKKHQEAFFYFDFDNVLYTPHSYQRHQEVVRAINTLKSTQVFILTARSTADKMQELVRIVERLGYNIPAENIIPAGYAKAEKLVSEFERHSKCPACDPATLFFFDDNMMNVYFVDEETTEENKHYLHVYWVDHFKEHQTYQSMIEWQKVLTDADFPFLSNDDGKSLVFGPVLEAVLNKSDIKKRTKFYYA